MLNDKENKKKVMIHPSYYGIPHNDWREHQYETVEWLQSDKSPVKILEAPTGSGKTSTVTAIGHRKRIMSLVMTKLLQEENYGNIYNWDILFGKGNYECVHPDAEYNTSADQCLFASKGMNNCPYSSDCEYLIKKAKTIASNRSSLNYAYYLLSAWPKKNKYDYLAMDEAHMLSDITLDFAGINIHDETRIYWQLPDFPILDSSNGGSIFFNQIDPVDIIRDWLQKCIERLNDVYKHLEVALIHDSTDVSVLKDIVRCKNQLSKFTSTLDSIRSNSNQWFIQSSRDLIMYRGKKIPGLIARPLTARHHFPGLFLNNPESIMMSATIGDVAAFAEELGIEEYSFRSVPSVWKPETRPIRILDTPRMGYKSTDADYEKQADAIAAAINNCPSSWMGVIHVSRIAESPLLATRLAKRGLSRRVWIPPTNCGTNIQLQEWEKHKKVSNGAIAIAWSWTEGVDLFNEKICISAKTPFPALGDPYERSRQRAYPKHYSQRTAWKLVQSLGRTRRGDPSHYDTNGQANGLVAIADGNWTRIKKYISQDILDSMIYD